MGFRKANPVIFVISKLQTGFVMGFAKMSQNFHPLRVCATVENMGVDKYPGIIQAVTIGHEGTEKLLLSINSKVYSGICFP